MLKFKFISIHNTLVTFIPLNFHWEVVNICSKSSLKIMNAFQQSVSNIVFGLFLFLLMFWHLSTINKHLLIINWLWKILRACSWDFAKSFECFQNSLLAKVAAVFQHYSWVEMFKALICHLKNTYLFSNNELALTSAIMNSPSSSL